jgi:hypothetical protein
MKAIIALLSLALFFAACNKHNEHPKSTIELVSGRWSIDKIQQGTFQNNVLDDTTFVGTSADYFEFGQNENGKLHLLGADLQFSWRISHDTCIIEELDKFKIQTLTDKKMVLYGKVMLNQKDYTDIQYNLYR